MGRKTWPPRNRAGAWVCSVPRVRSPAITRISLSNRAAVISIALCRPFRGSMVPMLDSSTVEGWLPSGIRTTEMRLGNFPRVDIATCQQPT